MDQNTDRESNKLEERKLKEIEHSRKRRQILQGYERWSDTHESETAPDLSGLIRDPEAFKREFSNVKFYSICAASDHYCRDWLRERCQGATALDYCCGNGENGIIMAQYGAKVVGIDISHEGIVNARLNAKQAGVGDRCRFLVMDGEKMSFPDSTFDVIMEYGALHHLEFDRAMAELRRVVKPDGEVICVEALRHNPLIHLYRKLTPHLRTAWEVDHILTVQHLARAEKFFREVRVRFFHLAVLAAVPFRKTRLFPGLRRLLTLVDEVLLRPRSVGKYAWIMVFTLGKPKKA